MQDMVDLAYEWLKLERADFDYVDTLTDQITAASLESRASTVSIYVTVRARLEQLCPRSSPPESWLLNTLAYQSQWLHGWFGFITNERPELTRQLQVVSSPRRQRDRKRFADDIAAINATLASLESLDQRAPVQLDVGLLFALFRSYRIEHEPCGDEWFIQLGAFDRELRSLPDPDTAFARELVKEIRALTADENNESVDRVLDAFCELRGEVELLRLRSGSEVETNSHKTAIAPERPARDAFQCFALCLQGRRQTDVAKEVYGTERKQYQVSRNVKRVENYLRDLGVPKSDWKEESKKPEFTQWDDGTLDLGRRQDGLTPRQRQQFDEDEWD